jgi:hypothetical protein
MLAWTLTLALVKIMTTFQFLTPFVFKMLTWSMPVIKLMFPDCFTCVFFFSRAKPQGWFRISWICSYVFLKGKVNNPVPQYYLTSPLLYIWFCCDPTPCGYSLPWQGLKAGTKKQKYEKISEKKVSTSIEVCRCFMIMCWFVL